MYVPLSESSAWRGQYYSPKPKPKKKGLKITLWALVIIVPIALLFLLLLRKKGKPTSTSTPTLPPPSVFASRRNKSWSITPIGTLESSSIPSLGWDKGATSTLSSTTFWTFGDVLSVPAFDPKTGFADTAAFYSTPSDILRVDMGNITNVLGHDFGQAWSGDEAPDPNGATPSWGLGTSNVVEVSDGVGLGWMWEAWRNVNGSYEDRGGGPIRVTLGEQAPIANRTGPLVSGPDSIQVGLMTIMEADGFVYVYAQGGSTSAGVVCGRVKVEDAFDTDKYEFQLTTGEWAPGIPLVNDTRYGMTREGGPIHSDGMGTVMYNNYYKKYMMFVCAFGNDMNFYVSDTPYGPWGKEYGLLHVLGYGISVHTAWDPAGDGSHRQLYISGGWDNIITVYKINFAL